jgi:NADH:ubiquinone oxidoreductase subunit K
MTTAPAPSSAYLRVLGVAMIALGASAVMIGLSIYLLGGAATGNATQAMAARLTGAARSAPWATDPTMESEFGFYAPLWIAYGAVLIATARDLARTLHRVPILAAVFFAGGVGRALAWARVGSPRSAFVLLMMIELVLPALFIGLWAMARHSDRRAAAT